MPAGVVADDAAVKPAEQQRTAPNEHGGDEPHAHDDDDVTRLSGTTARESEEAFAEERPAPNPEIET